MKSYSIFVNTTDKFEDCWIPFFKLFSIYWPSYDGVIYLNTEYKEFIFPGLNIISIKNCKDRIEKSTPTWSECLINGLISVETDIVLYMQEDYFFNSMVNADIVNKYASLLSSIDAGCIHLTTVSGGAPFNKTKYPDLLEIGKLAKYRVSCQAALWKKDVLLSYVRKHENPWQFEKYATKRSRLIDQSFYAINKAFYGGNTVMPYVLTGIIQGTWKEEVVSLFGKYGIIIDFSRRGFFKGNVQRSLLQRFKSRYPKLYREFLSEVDLICLRLKLFLK